MAEYLASRLSTGNKLFPPSVATESEGMRIKFPKLFGGNETFVSYNDISSISYDAPMIGFTQLHINIRGNVTTVEGFYKGDCQTIINTWKKAKKGDKKQEWKQNGKLEDKKRLNEIKEEESGNITNKTLGKSQQELSASQQMKLEVTKLKIDAKVREEERKIRAKEKEKELEEERKEKEKEKKRERAEIRVEKGKEIAAGITSNVKEWLSEKDTEDDEDKEEKAEKRKKKKRLDQVRSIKLSPTDKDALIKSITSLSEYADMWAEESNPEEYLMVAKSNFDSGIAMLQALTPNDPMVSYFIQKQTILEKRAKKTKLMKLLLTIIVIIGIVGLFTFIYVTDKK